MGDQTATDSTRALARILVFETILIAGVIGVFLATGNVVYLIGGIIGSQIIVAPMILRWVQARRESGINQGSAGQQ